MTLGAKSKSSGQSVRPSRLLLAVGIVLLGLCAALPFRRPARPVAAPRERPAPLSLTLRRPDAPLELAPRIDVSPAVGLVEGRSQGSGARSQEPDVRRVEQADLANLVPTPTLPVSFQPSAANHEASEWRPSGASRLPRPKSQPRPYRLRDGDTLEKIADRLLGNPQRAGEIFELNRGLLARPDLLPIGATIMLPPRENADDLEPVRSQQ
jgi:nucleoid-associated protein YgaU